MTYPSFTQSRRQHPLRQIICELSDFIDENTEIQTPESLIIIGKQVLHKFEIEGQEN